MTRFVFLAPVACVMSWGAVAQAEELPKRRVGLWESSMTRSNDASPQVVKQCIDEKTDAQVLASTQGPNSPCKQVRFVKTAQGYETETSCTFGQTTSTAKALITGDFNLKVTTQITSTVVTAPGQQPVTTVSTIEARYVGPCAADQRPGDIIMPDGKVVRTPGVPK